MTRYDNVVLYHANCVDGFTSAWVAWSYLSNFDEDNEYIPVVYGDPLPDAALNCGRLFIIDFSYPPNELQRLVEANNYPDVVLLDHHESAVRKLEGFKFPERWRVVFDMSKCGAKLAWEYFFPEEQTPAIVDYVEDGDLWRWALPNSREVAAYLGTVDFDFDGWNKMSNVLANDATKEEVVTAGTAMLKYRDANVARISRNPGFTMIAGHRVPCVNSRLWQSEIGNVLSKNHPFACVWFVHDNGDYVYSLRSDNKRPAEAVNVAEIAEMYGGGGHRHAAGFRASAPPIMFPPVE